MKKVTFLLNIRLHREIITGHADDQNDMYFKAIEKIIFSMCEIFTVE
jgi:hypothetical protein